MSKQMKRKIYHGSSEIIKKPEFGYGKPYNDYGLGFYCTEQIDMAREWGVSKEKDGIANCYEIDCSGLEILNLNDEKYCILHWLSILLENREFEVSSALAAEAKEYILKNFKIEYEEYAAIVGYRADDSYFSFAADFAISEAFWTFPASPEFALAAEGCSVFLLSVAIASLVPTGIVLSEVVEIPDSIIFCKDCISDTPTDILSSLRSRYRKNTNGATV